jgi:hypothetical protein
MKIDGYAILVVNENGTKSYVVDHNSHDNRLQHCLQWGDMNLEEELLPDGLNDCLVMVFFNYTSVRSSCWEYDEYEDILTIQQHVVMQESYKEFWREQISFTITYDGHRECPREFEDKDKEVENWVDELIEEWEELYDEEFILHKKYEHKNKHARTNSWLFDSKTLDL